MWDECGTLSGILVITITLCFLHSLTLSIFLAAALIVHLLYTSQAVRQVDMSAYVKYIEMRIYTIPNAFGMVYTILYSVGMVCRQWLGHTPPGTALYSRVPCFC